MGESEENGWGAYKLSVMHQLQYLTAEVHGAKDAINKLDRDTIEKLGGLKQEIALLKQKAGIWGAIAALIITTAIQIAVSFLKH